MIIFSIVFGVCFVIQHVYGQTTQAVLEQNYFIETTNVILRVPIPGIELSKTYFETCSGYTEPVWCCAQECYDNQPNSYVALLHYSTDIANNPKWTCSCYTDDYRFWEGSLAQGLFASYRFPKPHVYKAYRYLDLNGESNVKELVDQSCDYLQDSSKTYDPDEFFIESLSSSNLTDCHLKCQESTYQCTHFEFFDRQCTLYHNCKTPQSALDPIGTYMRPTAAPTQPPSFNYTNYPSNVPSHVPTLRPTISPTTGVPSAAPITDYRISERFESIRGLGRRKCDTGFVYNSLTLSQSNGYRYTPNPFNHCIQLCDDDNQCAAVIFNFVSIDKTCSNYYKCRRGVRCDFLTHCRRSDDNPRNFNDEIIFFKKSWDPRTLVKYLDGYTCYGDISSLIASYNVGNRFDYVYECSKLCYDAINVNNTICTHFELTDNFATCNLYNYCVPFGEYSNTTALQNILYELDSRQLSTAPTQSPTADNENVDIVYDINTVLMIGGIGVVIVLVIAANLNCYLPEEYQILAERITI